MANALSHVTGGLVESICAWIRAAPDPEAQPELLTAFFEMCHRTLVCKPSLLLNLAAVLHFLPLSAPATLPAHPHGRPPARSDTPALSSPPPLNSDTTYITHAPINFS